MEVVIISAYLLDLLLGDPKWLPHPVRWIGRFIAFLETRIRQFTKTPLAEKIGGMFLFTIIVGTVYISAWLFLYIAYRLSPIAYYLLSIFLVYTTISVKSLHQEASSVIHALELSNPPLPIAMLRSNGSPAPFSTGVPAKAGENPPFREDFKTPFLDEARKRLAMIVGRDTQNLSKEDIYRAVTETVSENTSDGIIAPLFYLAMGGPALAMAYKAINTLDSMVGYKSERYKNIGWFSAKMDDVFNFIPARLTALLMVISSFILRLDWKNSVRIVCRDARNHTSPNAGYPEAAVAGALNCQLGGDNYYFGELIKKPLIGDKSYPLDRQMVDSTIKIMHLTTFLFIIGYGLLVLGFRF